MKNVKMRFVEKNVKTFYIYVQKKSLHVKACIRTEQIVTADQKGNWLMYRQV